MRLLFYVSGHGYGHATRMAEVMRALLARRADVEISVRSTAPSWLFPDRVAYARADLDCGVAESDDALKILAAESARRLEALLRDRAAVLEAERSAAGHFAPQLIVADIPFLAGYVAEAAGIPCIGISNFTWDWIYEPNLKTQRSWPEWDAVIRGGYERFAALWKLPFAQSERLASFREVADVPLIAPRSGREREDILREMGIEADGRPRVLIAMRAGVAEPVLQRALASAPDLLFLQGGQAGLNAPNLICPRGSSPSFHDLVRASDSILSKPGYSTVAQCVAERKPLLFVPRAGFREDPISLAEASRYIPLEELPVEAFRRGDWAAHLRRVLAKPLPAASMRSDGAEVCAEKLISHME